MKRLIKIFILLCFICNFKAFSGVCILFPKDKIYFSKKVLDSGIKRAKAQLFLTVSYFRNQIWTFDLDDDVKNSNDRVRIQADFCKQHKQYKNLVRELDELSMWPSTENLTEIKVDCFMQLLKKLFLVFDLFKCIKDLNIAFDGYEILKENTLKILRDGNEIFFVSFCEYCTLIDELADLNDKLIKQKVNLPPQEFSVALDLKNPEPPFKFGFLENLGGMQLPQDWVPVAFKI